MPACMIAFNLGATVVFLTIFLGCSDDNVLNSLKYFNFKVQMIQDKPQYEFQN